MSAFVPNIAHELLLEMLRQFAVDAKFDVDVNAERNVLVVAIPL